MKKLLLLFLVITIACSPVRKYSGTQDVTKWEKDIAAFERLDSEETYPADAILFTGSSSIRLWTTLANDMKPFNVIQRGYGGSKLSDFAFYADRIFEPHEISAAVMFIANDISGSESDKSPEEVKKLFLHVLKIFRKHHPSEPFFWIAITPTPSRWKVWPQIKEANELIAGECAKRANTYFISTEKSFLNEAGEPRPELFIKDMLHLNEDGYILWTSIIKKELEKVIMKTVAQTEIIGHRGASYLAPENTVASALLAWKHGADAVEVDIYLTSDNKVVCLHDKSTKRTTGEDHMVNETSSEVLRRLDAGSFKSPEYKGEKIPFLEEVIKTIPAGKELVVELKCGPEVLPFLKPAIEGNRANKKYTFICFDINTITETKKIFPNDPCYWLCSNTNLLEKTISSIPERKLEGISLSYNIIDENVMKMASGLNLAVYTWTVDDPEVAKRLIALGVKGITTNRPGWLREEIER